MAIAAVNASYVGNGPTGNGQRIADQTSGSLAQRLVAFGQFTGDGASTSATLNWVDGTVTPFGTWSGPAGNQTLTAAAPKVSAVSRGALSSAADTAASSIVVSLSAVSTTAATVAFSAAPANGALITVVVEIYPY